MVFTYVVRIPVAPTRGLYQPGRCCGVFHGIYLRSFYGIDFRRTGTGNCRYCCGLFTVGPDNLCSPRPSGGSAALIIRAMSTRKIAVPAAGFAGTIIMVGLYLLGGAFMTSFGAAAVEVPMNILQSAVGVTGGFILSRAVRKAYPPVKRLVW